MHCLLSLGAANTIEVTFRVDLMHCLLFLGALCLRCKVDKPHTFLGQGVDAGRGSTTIRAPLTGHPSCCRQHYCPRCSRIIASIFVFTAWRLKLAGSCIGG